MKIDDCLIELEEILEDAWSLPLIRGKVFINVDQLQKCFHEIRSTLPEELRQAKAIVADRGKIISDAKMEAETIIRIAEEKSRVMLSQDELVKNAKLTSDQILLEAKTQAKNIKKAANEYVEDLMKQTDDTLMNSITELRQARKDLRNSTQP